MPAGFSPTEEFLLLFNQMKQAARNKPENIETLYKNSEVFRASFEALHEFLNRSDLERRVFHSSKIVVPRAVGFEAAWKEYEEKWRFRIVPPKINQPVDEELVGYLLGLDNPTPEHAAILEKRLAEQREKIFRESTVERIKTPATLRIPDPDIEEEFDALQHDGGAALEFGMEQLEFHSGNSWDNYALNSCRLAIGAYDYLTETIGLNLRDVFRRWRDVPVVFMPAHVANRYGASDKGSLPSLLNDAVRAYIFGAPAAAIAMCRAAYEMIRKEHYRHGELENVVVQADYQHGHDEETIGDLVKRANEIMHNYHNRKRLSPDDDRTIVTFLATLKYFIEQAPSSK
jgi:hypothetical protein